jgi:hemoglobin/transferrin/lactoferrin receptor protein
VVLRLLSVSLHFVHFYFNEEDQAMLKLNHLALAAMLTCTRAVVAAQPESSSLGDITVQGDHIMDEVPATVTVITSEDIQERGARNIKDALADEPDVVVRTRPSNFTATRSSYGRGRNEGINVRGIEGNRLLIVQDGIRMPNSFSFGPAFQAGRGDYWDIDSLRKIEILRGSNSVQYGADSIAGVVSASALQVGDLVREGRTTGGFAQSSYAQQDNSFNHSAGIGFDDGRWQAMFMASTRSAHETWSQESDRTPDSTRTAPNPSNSESRYYLSRLGLRINASHRLLATLENFNTTVATDGLTAVSPFPVFRETRSLTARDTTRRQRISLEHFYQDGTQGWLTGLHTHLYRQQAGIRQFTGEQVYGPNSPDETTMFDYAGGFAAAIVPRALERTRDNHYRENTTGLLLVADGRLLTGAVEHRLRYGVDFSRSDISMKMDGTVPQTGKEFPYRASPDTAYMLAGLYVQDEIVAGSWHITPALRHDSYRLSPNADSLSASDKLSLETARATVSSQKAGAWSPRLGVMWKLTPGFTPYFNYARAFRAPEPGQINAHFSNPAMLYESAGNPDLRAEHVTSRELGVRGRLPGFTYSLAGFDSRYTDFIEQQRVGVNPTGTAYLYQYINFSRAHVRGFEARTEWKPDPAWRFNAAWAYTLGDLYAPRQFAFDASTNKFTHSDYSWRPLNTVQPMRVIVGTRYQQERWGAYVNVEHAWGKTRDRVAQPASGVIRSDTDPFTVVGVGAHVKPVPGMTVRFNVENLFNATYERWSDIGELDTATRRYSAPPRSLQVSLRYAF